MMQNNLMGGGMAQPATAPANPTGLNFQSDPSMRAQFKGFMSGMQAKQPAPMAPAPMQAPLPMPAPMQNVDIFQPQPMQMQMGGAVPRQAMMGGMPHMLSYITPGEAAALSAMGGTGQPGPGGVPSFVYDEAGMGPGVGRGSGPSMGDASFDYSGGGDDDANSFNIFEDTRDSFTLGPLSEDYNMSADRAAAQDALSTMLATEALQQDRQRQEDLARDITARGGAADIIEGFGPMSQVTGTTQTPMDPTEFAASNVKSVRDSVDAAAQNNLLDQVFDIDTRSYGPDTRFDIDTSYTPSPIGTPDQIKMQQSLAADARRELGALRTGPIGIPDEIQMRRDANAALNAPVNAPAVDTGSYDAIPNSIQQTIRDNLGAQNLGAMGQGSFPSAPSVPASDGIVRTEAGRTNRIADSGFGTGEITDAAGSRAPADQSFFGALMDTMTGREYPTDLQKEQNIVDATNRRTTITGDDRRADMSALDQLAKRAGQEGSGILGAFTNFSARNAANMYDDIVNKGYEPVYDRAGQIVATRVPGTDILGRGSVEGRIPGREFGGGGGGSAPRPVQAPQPSVADLVAKELAKLQPATPAPTQTAPTPITPAPVNAGPRAPATGGRSLGFGFGQLRRIPGISTNLNTAADDFLNLLGGANVQNFAKGGQVPRQTEIAGQPHMLSYITPGEAAALQAMGGSGASGPGGIPSFFYDEVGAVADTTGNIGSGGQNQDFGGDDDNDNNVSLSSISSVTDQGDNYTVSTNAANQMNQQAKADAEARAALEAANLQQQQTAPQNMIQTQAGTIDPASMSVGEKMSLIGEGLGNLLDIDLFSSTAPEVDADLAARYEAAGFNPETAAYAASGFSSGAAPNLSAMGADLARGGATPQSMAARQGMAPNTSVMGYSGPTGQIQTSAANQSIVQTRDPSQAGLAGTMNVPTSRNTGFLDSLSSMVSNLPSRSQIMDTIIGAPVDRTKLNIGGSGNNPFQSR